MNITDHLETIIADMCARLPEFSHIDPRRLLVCLTRARAARPGGVYAKIVPMRYPDGTPLKQVRGQCYALPQIPTQHGDILYLIYVYVPRFFDLPYERRVLTLVHELYHIAPAFDGTIRRIGSRAHGASREQFNANLQPLVDAYLAGALLPEGMALLRGELKTLSRQYTLVGRSLSIPKPVALN